MADHSMRAPRPRSASGNVPKVAGQAVRNVDRAGCEPAQAFTEFHPRSRPLQASNGLARGRHTRWQPTLQPGQPQRSVAQDAGNPDAVTGTAPERNSALPRGTSPRAVIETVTPALLRVVSPPASKQECRSASASRPRANARATPHRRAASQREEEAARRRAGRSKIREIDRERLVADRGRIRQEVDALDQHVGRHRPGPPAVEQRAVVAHAGPRVRRCAPGG